MEKLSNEQAKQEAIKSLWIEKIGEKEYNRIAPLINQYGYCTDSEIDEISLFKIDVLNQHVFDIVDYHNYETSNDFAPKGMNDVNLNNGWTRIEPDGSNLPTDDRRYKTGTLCLDGTFMTWEQVFKGNAVRLSGSTHYKPIEKELLPIY